MSALPVRTCACCLCLLDLQCAVQGCLQDVLSALVGMLQDCSCNRRNAYLDSGPLCHPSVEILHHSGQLSLL